MGRTGGCDRKKAVSHISNAAQRSVWTGVCIQCRLLHVLGSPTSKWNWVRSTCMCNCGIVQA